MQKLMDYFAGQALAGLTSDNPDGPYNPKLMAQLAWAISDAMMVQHGIRREARYDANLARLAERWCEECGNWSPPEKWLCDCPVHNEEEEKKDG